MKPLKTNKNTFRTSKTPKNLNRTPKNQNRTPKTRIQTPKTRIQTPKTLNQPWKLQIVLWKDSIHISLNKKLYGLRMTPNDSESKWSEIEENKNSALLGSKGNPKPPKILIVRILSESCCLWSEIKRRLRKIWIQLQKKRICSPFDSALSSIRSRPCSQHLPIYVTYSSNLHLYARSRYYISGPF